MEPSTPPSTDENLTQRVGAPELDTYIEALLHPKSILQGDCSRLSQSPKTPVKKEPVTPTSSGLKRKWSTSSDSPARRQCHCMESASCTSYPVKQELESPRSCNLECLPKDEMPNKNDADDNASPGASDEAWVEDEPSGSEDEHEDIDQNGDFGPFVPAMPNASSSRDGRTAAPKKARQKRGPRAKTAREYYTIHPLKQKFDLAWKIDMVAKIEAERKILKKNKKKSKASLQTNILKRNRKGQRTAGEVLESILNAGVSAPEVDADVNAGPMPDISVSQKGKFLNELLAKCPHLDLHKCKGEYNSLVQKSRTFGYQRVKKDGFGWRLQSMKTSLHDHQLTGTAWMIERECSEEGPHGGILADDVGVGKTLQAIALVVGNPATTEPKSTGIKATLIVVPNRVLYQWKDEFLAHSNIKPWVFQNADENNEIERVSESDVVLTTYYELMASLPYPNKATIRSWKKSPANIKKTTEDYIQDNMKDAAILHHITWYRIILDEAQTIKQHLGRFARAAIALKGENRWALTATPIMNRCEEFYPLFNFIQDPFIESYSFAKFKNLFCDATDNLSRQALEVSLSNIIIRRQKDDKILKRPLVSLLPSHNEDIEIHMAPPERLLYRAVRGRLRELSNQSFVKGDPRKKLSDVPSQFTILRQMVANLDIVERQIKVLFDFQDFSQLQERLNSLRLTAKSDAIRRIVQQRIKTWIKEKKKSASDPTSASEKEGICVMCNEGDDDPVYLTKCKHVFCKPCIEKHPIHDAEDDDDVQLCPCCRTSFNSNQMKPWNPLTKGASEQFPNSKKRAKDARGFRPTLVPQQAHWLKRIDEGELEVFPSAKLIETMEILCQWRRDAPGEKVIIFTQWKPLLIMVGMKLLEENQKFVYFTGDMNSKRQGETISIFRGSPQINVMLASLKAGGTGLNFQFANRMIIMDLWWNTAAEAQAFGRINRWGQTRETYLKKLVVTNSIEIGIFGLQKSKDKMVARLMKDNLEKLSIQDMATVLGGQATEDENGQSTIVYDDDGNDDADLNDADLNDADDDENDIDMEDANDYDSATNGLDDE